MKRLSLRSLFARLFQPVRATGAVRRFPSPCVMQLEDRVVPATFHVALSGDDGAGDGSINNPFRTIQAGINAAAATSDGNDFVNVAAGTYNTAGVDLDLVVPASATLQNLQLLGGWDATFSTRTPRTTIYASQTAHADANSIDLQVLDANTTIDGFTFVFDGTPGMGGARPSGGLTVSATNVVVNNNLFEVGHTGANPRSVGVQNSNTDISGLQILNNDFLVEGTARGHAIFLGPSAPRTTPVLIQGNDISGTMLAAAVVISEEGNVQFLDNTITRSGTATGFQAIDIRASNSLTALTDVTIAGNTIDGGGTGTGIHVSSVASATQTISGLTIANNILRNHVGFAAVVIGPGANQLNAITATINYNSITGNTTGLFRSTLGTGSTTVDATRNWWGDLSGPTTTANPGGTGQPINDTTGITFRPWLIYDPDADTTQPGVQLPTTVTVTAGNDVSAAVNDYTLLQNAVGAVADGQTLNLVGNFDWTQPNAAAAWALGNDAVAGTDDDYALVAPPDVHNVTVTASSRGMATIQGPGDLAAANLEGAFTFNGGDNQNWTISNLEILDFDLGIGMFFGAGGLDAFNGTTITNNRIRIATDLTSVAAPLDVNQNIGIHYSAGTNQTISNNLIEIGGNGVSDPTADLTTNRAAFSSSVGIQSNAPEGSAVDGLLITGNTVRILNAQNDANPERIIGYWENSTAHSSDITVSNNQFVNLAAGNNPATNLQQAFWVTSHSSATTTVTYTGNTVQGASIGFKWLGDPEFPGQNFAGNQAVRLWQNTLTDNNTAVLIQSNGVANLFQNTITGSRSVGVNVLSGSLTGSGTVTNAVQENFISDGQAGIVLAAGTTVTGNIFNNDLSGNVGLALDNQSATAVNAEFNWWGTNNPAGVDAEVNGNVDFTPFLNTGTDTRPGTPGFQGDLSVGAGQGNVTVTVQNGVLVVKGDLFNNLVRIERTADPTAYRVTGLSGTQVNGINSTEGAIFSGVTQGINAGLGKGDDQIFFDGSVIPFANPGSIQVRGGEGNDLIEFDRVSTGSGQTVEILGGSGDDRVRLIDAVFGANLIAHLGAGNDTAELTRVTANGPTEVRMGMGNTDAIVVNDSDFTASVAFVGGLGDADSLDAGTNDTPNSNGNTFTLPPTIEGIEVVV